MLLECYICKAACKPHKRVMSSLSDSKISFHTKICWGTTVHGQHKGCITYFVLQFSLTEKKGITVMVTFSFSAIKKNTSGIQLSRENEKILYKIYTYLAILLYISMLFE